MNHLILCSIFVTGACVSAWAGDQVQNGAIVGTVIDPKGSAIVKAKITVANAATKVKVTVSTTSDGSYTIPSLPPNPYDITIEAKGFNKYLSKDVQVDGQDTIRLDVQLEYSDATITKQEAELLIEAYERTYQDGGKTPHQESGIHACRPGHALLDLDLSSDTLFCYHVSNDLTSEESRVDESTEREGLRACPLGWYVRGVRDTTRVEGKLITTVKHQFALLCSKRPDVTPSGEQKLSGGCVDDWHEIAETIKDPDRHGPAEYWPITVMTGITGGKHSTNDKDVLCSTIEPIPPGKVLFYHQCAACHGTDGNAPISLTRMFKKIYARPLGSAEVQAMTDADLQKVFAAKHGGETNRVKLSSVETQDLLRFLRTLKQ